MPPATRPVFSLAYLTTLNLAPPQAIEIAAELGYDQVGLRLLPSAPGGLAFPLMDDAAMLRETQARLQATGVSVCDLEIIRIGAGFDLAATRPFLDVGAQLGARAVLVAGDDPEPARLAQNYAAFCAEAARFGLTADLEFMPWTCVPHLRSAVAVLEAAGRPANASVLVDALHWARSDSSLAEVRALPRAWLHYAQMCDAPAEIPRTTEGLIHTARCERLLPGEGGIALRELFGALPADLPVSVEVPNEPGVARLGAREWARRALAAAQAVWAARTAAA
ncbi:MAG: hypothetical protein RLY71_1312 [Pseudomonadota bacterium]|jgi:sugar phosphate isomerase/epimerase